MVHVLLRVVPVSRNCGQWRATISTNILGHPPSVAHYNRSLSRPFTSVH